MAGNVPGTLRALALIVSMSVSCTSRVVTDSLVLPPDVVRVDVAPAAVTIETGASQAFSATAYLIDSTSENASVTWSKTGGGSISAAGIYTAPATPGNYLVIATLSGSSLVDTAQVAVILSPTTLVGIEVTPGAVGLDPGATQTFIATGRMSDATSKPVAVNWSASEGSITTGGVYTAPDTAGSYRVIARLSGGTLRDTSDVTVNQGTPPPPPVSGDIPELPAGYTLRATHTGSPLVPAGWVTNSDGTSGVSVFNDSLAPASPSQVMRVNYPAGMADGSAPVGVEFSGTDGARQLFATYWFKYNSTFQGHDSQVNKHLFVFGANGTVLVYSEMRFVGNVSQGNMDFQFQGGMASPTYDKRLVDNYGGNGLKIFKDRWHRVSLELIYGSNSSGIVRAWVDGVKVGEITNANFATGIGVVKIDPTWGGNSGDRMTEAGYLYFDEVRFYTR